MVDNILTTDRTGADLDIAAKDIGDVQFPRNILTDPLGNDLTPLTDAQLRADDIPVADDRAGNLLGNILRTLLAPLGYDKSLQRQRGTVIVESGTISSVTAVAAVTNQVGMGGFNADMLVRAQVNAAWALNVRARIT